MNLETGKKEARLIPKRSPELRESVRPSTPPKQEERGMVMVPSVVESDDSPEPLEASGPHSDLMEHQEMPTSGDELATEKIKEIFLGLPEPEPELLRAMKANISPEEMNKLLRRLWEKRQVELKDAMERMVDDATLLKKFIVELLDETKTDDYKVGVLTDIEFLVSKIDNARDFVQVCPLFPLKGSALDYATFDLSRWMGWWLCCR